MDGGEREGRVEEVVEGRGVSGARKEDGSLCLWGPLDLDLSLWLRALLRRVERRW